MKNCLGVALAGLLVPVTGFSAESFLHESTALDSFVQNANGSPKAISAAIVVCGEQPHALGQVS